MPKMKRKDKDGTNPVALILIVCCLIAGFVIGSLDIFKVPENAGLTERMGYFLLQFLLLFLSFFLQIIIHEGGHLIAGLLTGYRFSSFRIGKLMLLKNHEGYSFKKFSLAGTGGQCLLIPPDRETGGLYPYKLYNLGGVLMNLITAVLSFTVFFFITEKNTVSTFFLFLAITGVILALMNGVPMRTGGIATDGYNVIHIGQELFALDAMWLQLKFNEAQVEGVRLKNLPEEWFRIPDNADKNNEIISTISVFSENRAMDELDFRKAKEIIAMLENSEEYSIIGLYKNLLLFDKVTIDLIENGTNADISELEDRQIKAFRKTMRNYPAVIRTEYAIQLLKNRDFAAAEKYRHAFNAVASKYPWKSDIDSETDVMNYLDSCANKN